MRVNLSVFYINGDWIFLRPAHPDPRCKQQAAVCRLYNSIDNPDDLVSKPPYVAIGSLSRPAVGKRSLPKLNRKAIWKYLTLTEYMSDMLGCVTCMIYVEELGCSRTVQVSTIFSR